MKSTTARIHFNEDGTPVADDFDDVYFSNEDGLAETRYVFIEANSLLARWQNSNASSFTIAETGFGTGLNFLVTLALFTQFRQTNPSHPLTHLYFVSTEKYPLCVSDLERALCAFPSLSEETKALVTNYPDALEGCHRRHFANSTVTLDLWIGDVHTTLPQWLSPQQGLVDAWYLDGFAPSKNPSMWSQNLFELMAKLSKPNATFATFTAAGFVRRGLQSAGFNVEKIAGFGKKRNMLRGVIEKHGGAAHCTPTDPTTYPYATPELTTEDTVVIIGAGLAGSACALALCEKGIKVVLIDSASPASGASGNPQGGFYPQLHSEASIASQIQALCFAYARRYYAQLASAFDYAHDWCGVLQLAFNDSTASRLHKLTQNGCWPESMARVVSSSDASAIAGLALPYSALYIQDGGWISPPELVTATLNQAAQYGCLQVMNHTLVDRITESADEVTLYLRDKQSLSVSHVIVASGHQSTSFSPHHPIPLRPVRGQVEALPANDDTTKLKTVLCHKGYFTPVYQQRHALGSTYVKSDTQTDVRASESEQNLNTHRQALLQCEWVDTFKHDGKARAAVRLSTPDHQPVCGAVGTIDTVYSMYHELAKGKPKSAMSIAPSTRISTLTALGSRGLTTAPLLAQALVSALTRSPMPFSQTLWAALSANRFAVKDCIRGTPPP